MPNIASTLKEEITRIARKEVRNEIANLRKAVTTQRSEIAELRRRAAIADKELGAVNKARAKQQAPSEQRSTDASAKKGLRFSAKGLASNRKRLGLSAEQFGLLVGVAGQSIYNWEAGQSRPRERFLPAIAELKKIGKKGASARLHALKEQIA